MAEKKKTKALGREPGEETYCDKTVSGNHLWVVMGGNIPEFARFKVCLACGLVDDKLDK